MPTHAATARPLNKMEAARQILASDPEIDHLQLQAILKKDFKMHMSPKQAYNYRRDILKKLSHPNRPSRNGAAPVPAPTAPAQADLAELVRIGNAIGWEKVREVAEIAVAVTK